MPRGHKLSRLDFSQHACYEQNKQVYEYIESTSQIEYVILSARWTLGMEGVRFDNKEGGVEYGRKPHLDIVENGKYLYHEDYQHQDAISQAYIKSIHSLLEAGKKVILIYPVPEVGWNVPDYLMRYYFQAPDFVFHDSTASTSYEVYKERNKRTIDALDKVRVSENLSRIFPGNIFCNNSLLERCVVQKGGLIFYKDDDHLSDAGAWVLVERIISHL